MRPSIESASYWLATRPDHHPAPRFDGNRHVDIAIIGAGFTGLWVAHFLKQLEPQLDVVVLEQGITGYGGSGRNAGQVSSGIDHTHKLAIAHFGIDEARRMSRVGLQNIEELQQFIRDRGIDCDFERSGQLAVALTPVQGIEAHDLVAAAEQLGVAGVRFLSQEETRSELNSPLYLGGVADPGWGIVNPIKLVDGLQRDAERLGVDFFEHTRVRTLEQTSGKIHVQTPAGTVSAGKVVLATDVYTHQLFPQLLRRYIPLYDYILVSEPLTADQLTEIGWRNRQAVVDFRTFFNYYRLTADNRILWGTSEARYYPPNRVEAACDHSEPHYTTLRESFRRHFPQLANLNFPYAWGGPIASTTRLTPFFGTLKKGRVLYGLGYTGLGVANSRLVGKILAHMVLARPSELLDLEMVQRQPLPYPPEPLRRLAVNAVTASLRRVDAGGKPGMLLRILDTLGIGFSS